MRANELKDRRKGTSLRILYLVLGGIGLIAAAGTLAYPGIAVFREFGANVATESLALIVTLAVVRRILDRQERNRRLRASVGALRKAARSLRDLADSWADLVKGALPRIPAERPTSYEELLASHYTEALAWLDPDDRPARGPSGPLAEEPTGIGGAAGDGGGDGADGSPVRARVRRIAERRQTLASLTQAYAVVLDGDYVEALEAVVDDRFTSLLTGLAEAGADAGTWRRSINLARGPRESCFRALLLAIRLHNQLATEAAGQRSEQLLPRADLLDIALSTEDDLLVATALTPDFWSAAPAPGALRPGGGRKASPGRRFT